MGAEDFAFMLERKPGANISLGVGGKKGPLHSSSYDFNDDILETGIKFWIHLVQSTLFVS